MRSFLTVASCASLAAAHGYLKEYIIDGNTFPAFYGKMDADPKWQVRRVDYGYAKGGPPVEDVTSLDITCRSHPLILPAMTAPIRAGANITFQWTDWFTNHKGPVLTYMGLLKDDNTKPEDVDFFKIHEDTYDPKDWTWGTDRLIERDNNFHTVTVPSDIKPGTYIVRHELFALHNALNDNYKAKRSGAQFYPNCVKVKVTGSGTATPPGQKLPGMYKWDDKGILINIYYSPNEYISPGPAVYKPTTNTAPEGPRPVVTETGNPTGELGKQYAAIKAQADRGFEDVVHADSDNKRGGGGCHWEPGTDPKTAKCVAVNPDFPKWAGHAQPPASPMYVDEISANRGKGTGPFITYLFDPTAPRAEEKARAKEAAAAAAGNTVRAFMA